jgi:hypothetical protein
MGVVPVHESEAGERYSESFQVTAGTEFVSGERGLREVRLREGAVMKTELFSRTLGALVLMLGMGGGGCAGGAGEDPVVEGVATGTVSVPLVTTVNDHVYRLSNALIYLFGPYGTVAVTSSDDPNETVLAQALQVGSYDPLLVSWTLERQAEDGSFQPVPATLIASPSRFEIFNGTTTSISYQFETDGLPIPIGTGNLDVTVDVIERTPACTPLGTDCGEGSWCPPPELTGSAPACFAAGTLEVGQPCNGPTACVANASCFDFGTAPICAALCAPGDFGGPCSSGGICQPAGTSYGVCG